MDQKCLLALWSLSFSRFSSQLRSWGFLILSREKTSLSFLLTICLFILILVNRQMTQFLMLSSSSSWKSRERSMMRLYSKFSSMSSRWLVILLMISTQLKLFISFWQRWICLVSICSRLPKLKFNCCAFFIFQKRFSSISDRYTLYRFYQDRSSIFMSLSASLLWRVIMRICIISLKLSISLLLTCRRTSIGKLGQKNATLYPPYIIGSRSETQASSLSQPTLFINQLTNQQQHHTRTRAIKVIWGGCR